MASGAGQERAEIEGEEGWEACDAGNSTDFVQAFSFFPAEPITVQPGIREPPILAWCRPPSHLEAAAANTSQHTRVLAAAAAATDTTRAAAADTAASNDTVEDSPPPQPDHVNAAACDCPQPASELVARQKYDDFGAPRYELFLAVNRCVCLCVR